MSFLAPITALIAAAVAIPALLALYFLKLRRREMLIPSTLLWKKAIQDMQVNAPFQKLRRNLLLLVQLLILLALLLAMARPMIQALTRPGQRVAILIDHSASMNATDLSPTRLDEAKRAALQLIDNLDGDGGAAMVVSFADRARVVQPFTGDLSLLRAAVRNIEPTDERSHLASALQLIEPFALEAQASDDDSLMVYVLSDGHVHLPGQGEQALALKGAELQFVRTAGDGAIDNVGLASFSARRDFERPELVQVFARLVNAGPSPVTANLELRVDGGLLRVQQTQVAAANEDGPGEASVQFDFVMPGAGLVELRHDHDDMLKADNVARLMLAPSRRLRVLLVSEGNPFLERVIRSVGVRDLVLMYPQKYEDQRADQLKRGGWEDAAGAIAGANEGFDVIVFDAYAPKNLPPVSSLYFAASPPIDGLGIRRPEAESAQAQVVLDWQRDHPLMRYVVLDDVVMSSPGRLVVPADAVVLATGQSGPVLAELRREGVRHVVASFDVLQTNWPLYVSFPVFVTNVVQTLGLGGLTEEAGVAYRTGDVPMVPTDETADTLTYDGPVSVAGRVSQGQAVLSVLSRVGLYRTQNDVQPPYDQLAVNLLDTEESDLRPAEKLEVGSVAVSGGSRVAMIRREVWPWFIWTALAVLLLEWVIYTRRMHL